MGAEGDTSYATYFIDVVPVAVVSKNTHVFLKKNKKIKTFLQDSN